MSDLLKEAIADAKAVRETALQNAKMALQEAFTPHLKSMLSAKLREDDDEYADDDDFEGEEEFGGEDEFAGEDEIEGGAISDEVPSDDIDIDMDMGDEEPEMEEEGIIEIDGVKYAPIVSEDELETDEFGGDDEEFEDDEEALDLESIIRELEADINEEDDLEESDNPYDNNEQHNDYKSVKTESADEDEDEEFEVDESLFLEDDDLDEEVDQSSGIGTGTGKGSTDKSSGIGNSNKKLKEVTAQLSEYKEVVGFLRDKLSEVNILNAKLLFTNKIFKQYALSNNQKMKVVENFDRARTTREIKLVYTTLCENFTSTGPVKRKSINELASAKSGSTKPSRKIITEESAVANRFKKLAGIN